MLHCKHFTIQYLGSAELKKSQGTNQDIAYVIYNMHSRYNKEKARIKKARKVVLCVDAEKICVQSRDDGKTLMRFPLTHVQDVTTCLNKNPYSKTCVLVAKEVDESRHKAFVFYCKTTREAIQLYQAASTAFEIGYERLNSSHPNSMETNSDNFDLDNHQRQDRNLKEEGVMRSSQVKKHESAMSRRWNENSDLELWRQTLAGDKIEKSPLDFATAIQMTEMLKENDEENISSIESNVELELLEVDSALDRDMNSSISSVCRKTAKKTSRCLLSRWVRSSYQNFRKISGRYSRATVDQDEV